MNETKSQSTKLFLAKVMIISLVGTLLFGALTASCVRKKNEPTQPYKLAMDGDVLSIDDSRIRATVLISVVYQDGSGNDHPRCTGVAISPKIVLTARHCISFSRTARVYAHQDKNGDLKLSYPVKKVMFPNCKKSINSKAPIDGPNDLAALVIDGIMDPRYIKPAKLPDISNPDIKTIKDNPDAPNRGYPFSLVGASHSWGTGLTSSSELRLASSILIDAEHYGDEGGPTIAMLARTDPGDSGGPLFVRTRNGWELIGTLIGMNPDIHASLYVMTFV